MSFLLATFQHHQCMITSSFLSSAHFRYALCKIASIQPLPPQDPQPPVVDQCALKTDVVDIMRAKQMASPYLWSLKSTGGSATNTNMQLLVNKLYRE